MCVHICTHMLISTKAIINRGQHAHSLKSVQIAAPTPHGLFTMLYWYMQCVERWIAIFFCLSFVHPCVPLCCCVCVCLSMCTYYPYVN